MRQGELFLVGVDDDGHGLDGSVGLPTTLDVAEGRIIRCQPLRWRVGEDLGVDSGGVSNEAIGAVANLLE